MQRSDRLSEDLGRAVMRVRRAILAEARTRLLEGGEDLLAWQALNQLDRYGPIAQNELADRVGQHPTGLSRLLAELEAQRVVKRTRDGGDRRKVLVALTTAGKARLEGGRPAVRSAVEQVFRPLTAADRKALRALLGRVLGDSA